MIRCQACGEDVTRHNRDKISACPSCGVSLWRVDQTSLRARKRFELVTAMAGATEYSFHNHNSGANENVLAYIEAIIIRADAILEEVYGEMP